MNRGARRDPIFHSAGDAYGFLDVVGVVVERFELEVHSYCLMGNHYHLLVRSVEANLSRALQYLDGVYTQRYNRRHAHDGPLFRGRFHSVLVDSDAYLMAVAVYIHRNPLEAAMVSDLRSHRWSSYQSYLGRCRPEPWLSMDEIRARVPNRAALRAMTERLPLPEEVETFYGHRQLGPVLGGDEFRIEAQRQIDSNSEVAPHEKRIGAQRSIQSLVNLVADEFGVDADIIMTPTPGRRNLPRSVAVALSTEEIGRSLAEVAEAFGMSGPSTAKSARRLVDRLVAEDRELADVVATIETRLGRKTNLRKTRSDPER